jgi:hypothetical protein
MHRLSGNWLLSDVRLRTSAKRRRSCSLGNHGGCGLAAEGESGTRRVALSNARFEVDDADPRSCRFGIAALGSAPRLHATNGSSGNSKAWSGWLRRRCGSLRRRGTRHVTKRPTLHGRFSTSSGPQNFCCSFPFSLQIVHGCPVIALLLSISDAYVAWVLWCPWTPREESDPSLITVVSSSVWRLFHF